MNKKGAGDLLAAKQAVPGVVQPQKGVGPMTDNIYGRINTGNSIMSINNLLFDIARPSSSSIVSSGKSGNKSSDDTLSLYDSTRDRYLVSTCTKSTRTNNNPNNGNEDSPFPKNLLNNNSISMVGGVNNYTECAEDTGIKNDGFAKKIQSSMRQLFPPIDSIPVNFAINSNIDDYTSSESNQDSFIFRTTNNEKMGESEASDENKATSTTSQQCAVQDSLLYVINPIQMGFLPIDYWRSSSVSLLEVFKNFFRARSTKRLRFEHKLWNALILTTTYPMLLPVIGVSWVTPTILKVHREIFGHLINITRPSAALFNTQGSFITHGFREVSTNEAISMKIPYNKIEDVDESIIRLFIHINGEFTMNSPKEQIAGCRWNKE